jgi:hypothetical protein
MKDIAPCVSYIVPVLNNLDTQVEQFYIQSGSMGIQAITL